MSYDYRYEACVAARGSAMHDKLEVLIDKSHVIRTLHELSDTSDATAAYARCKHSALLRFKDSKE